MKMLYWLPRILSLGLVFYLSIFALDVFSEYSGWNAVRPFLIHLIPSFVLLIIVFIAWKYDLVGFILFSSFSLIYILMVGLDRHWSWYIGISLPLAIVGFLFFCNWIHQRKIN